MAIWLVNEACSKTKSVWSGQNMMPHCIIQTKSLFVTYLKRKKIISIISLVLLLSHKMLSLEELNFFDPMLFVMCWMKLIFFRGLGIGKWICHFLFNSTLVLIIFTAQHSWAKLKVTKTVIKFPINFTQPHCLRAEEKRSWLGWMRGFWISYFHIF